MSRSIVAAAAALALSLGAGAASAQSRDVRGGAPGEFDFYVLALSWSPGFCAIEGDEKGREQCRPGARLGFVVHGLWPQNERGYPTECGSGSRNPTRQSMQVAQQVFPSEGLARHQWRKHGTCSGEGPTEYFQAVKRAAGAVRIPTELTRVESRKELAPIELERLFVAANPGLRADMMSVACRRGELQEVRICFTRDLRGFRSCAEVDRGGCRSREIFVQPMR